MPFGMLSGIGSVLGGLGGLFGSKKKKDPTPRENILSQAQGARDASDKYGFNPLTMLQYGQPGGAIVGGGGPAPLASIDLITGGLKDINDVVSGDAARRRAADQLEVDLAQVKIDQAKKQMALDHTRAAQMASSPLGRRAVTAHGAPHARIASPPMGRPVAKPTYLGRDVDVEDVPSTAGVAVLDTPLLPQAYVVPATGADGLDEMASAGLAISYQAQQDRRETLSDRAKKSWRGTDEEKAKAREEYARDMYRHPPGLAGMWTRAMSVWDIDVRGDLKKRKAK